MEIRQLQYFIALCEELNYTRAARKVYLTRQALRQSIASLERDVGEPLFANNRNHLSLTKRGQWLQYRAKPVVEGFAQLERDIFVSAQPVGPLRLGVSVALVPDYLPNLTHRLEQFKTLHPNIGLEVLLLPNDDIIAKTESGELELGLIMDLEPAVYRVPKTILRRDSLLLMLGREHPLYGQKEITILQLQGRRLALPGLRAEPFAPLLAACRNAGFELHCVEAKGYYQANFLVRNEGCIGITHATAGPTSRYDPTRDIPLQGVPPLCVSLLQKTDVSETFAALLCEELRQAAAEN